MSSRRRDFTRRPQRSNLVRQIRATHRGYQRTGQTVVDVDRAERRGTSVFDLYIVLRQEGQSILDLLGDRPPRKAFYYSRNDLRNRFPNDGNLRRDLRNIRRNEAAAPMTRQQLARTVIDATEKFKQDIIASVPLSRKDKRKQRAHAWADLNMVLSAIDLAFLAEDHSYSVELVELASGSIR